MTQQSRRVARRLLLTGGVCVLALALVLGLRRGAGDPVAEAEARLARPVGAIQWRGATLPRAIEDLERLSGTRIAVRWEALKAAGVSPGEPSIHADLRGVSCGAALWAALGQVSAHEPLWWAVRGGAPVVSTESDLVREVVVRAYDASDLIDPHYWPYTLAEWEVSVRHRALNEAAIGGRLYSNVCFPNTAPTQPPTRAEEAADRLDELANLLYGDFGTAAVAGFDGRLLVTASVDAHRNVQRLLDDLRTEGIAGRPALFSVRPAGSASGAERPSGGPVTRPATADEQLARVIPELDFSKGITVEQAFDHLRNQTRANLVVQWQALASIGINRDDVVKLRLWDVTLERALAVMLAAVSNDSVSVGYIGEDGIITVSTTDQFRGQQPMRVYDVRDVIVSMRQGDDDVYRPTGEEDTAKTTNEYVEELVTYIRDTIDPDSWRDNGGSVGSLRYWSGRLWIEQTPANHNRIEQRLEEIRAEFAKPMRPVPAATRPTGAASRPATRGAE